MNEKGIAKKGIIIILFICLALIVTSCSKGQTEAANNQSQQRQTENANDPPQQAITESNSIMLSCSKGENLAELQAKGLRVINEQSFPVILENLGEVKFISGIAKGYYDRPAAYFFLINDNEEVVCSFPEFPGNRHWVCFKVRAVAFTEVNHDGLTDIVVIAEYATGLGPSGAVPFPVASVYFQKGKEFVNDPDLDEQINDTGMNKTTKMVLKFLENRTTPVN